jgi:CAAX amino terminal protease family.
MIKKFADKTPIIFSFAVTIFVLVVYSIAQFGFAALFGVDMTAPAQDNIQNINFFTASILAKVVFSGLVMLILVMLKLSSVNNPFKKGFLKGLGLGWFVILGIILNFTFFFDFSSNISAIEQSKWLLLIPIFLETLLAGVSEELMCRGILYNVTNNKYKNVHAAAFLSSAVFGVVHFVNLVNASFAETALQVLFAFGFGVLLAAVYARCTTVWPGVLLHGLYNFAGYAAANLAFAETIDEKTLVIINVVQAVASICIALFLIRKKKMAEIAAA